MTVIEIPDEAAAILKAKASADGLTLEAWLEKLARQEAAPRRPIWEVISDRSKNLPPEVVDALPIDGASEHDHYLYGHPKKYL
jgi:hypothetical protein